MKNRIVAAVALAAAVSAPALAHEGDIGLALRNGRLVTGKVVDRGMGEKVVGVARVYGAEFTDFLGVPYTDEPGVFGEAGVFPTTGLGFDILGPLLKWDGAQFPLTPAPETLTIEKGPSSRTTPLVQSIVQGFSFPIGPAGFDEHYDFTLNPPRGDGVFALGLRLRTTGAIRESRPFYIVFNWNESEPTHDAAIEWAAENLVPAPGVGGLAVLALSSRTLRRCRR